MSDVDAQGENVSPAASDSPPVPVTPDAGMPVRALSHDLMPGRLAVASSLLTLHAQRLGTVGVSGIAALVFAAAFLFSSLLPLRTRVAGLREELSSVTVERPAPHAAPRPAQPASFVASLPTRKSLPGVLAAIVQQAEVAGLSLDHGVYQWSVGKSGAIAQYQLTLPVKGAYPDVRKFVDATLAAVPAAALAGITLERPNVGDAQVSADLRFVIFVRSAE